MVVNCFPIMVFLNVLAYELLNSTNGRYIQELGDDLLWTVLSCQMNAIINSLIHLVKNSRIKRYYAKLFNCRIVERNLRNVAPLRLSLNAKIQQ